MACLRELSHSVPDMSIHGSLSSVHCSLSLEHYQLIRGLLENNLGEPVEDFLRPYNLQDPSTYVRTRYPPLPFDLTDGQPQATTHAFILKYKNFRMISVNAKCCLTVVSVPRRF